MSATKVAPDTDALPRFLTIKQVAGLMCNNEFTLYHWIKESPERLPRFIRLHSRVLFLESDVRAWFRKFEAGAHTKHSAPAELVLEAATEAATEAAPRKRGRPTKAELARRRAIEQGHGDPQTQRPRNSMNLVKSKALQ